MEEETMTERILDLTLEILYLLTGERLPPVKSGDHLTISVPPPHSLTPQRHNLQKILEVTQKMIALLTGEGGLEGDVMDHQQSLWSWDPSGEPTPDDQSPYCKEESSPHTDLLPPTDLTHVPVGIKEEPAPCRDEIVISHIMESPLLCDEGSPLHADVSMAGDLPDITHHTPAPLKEEELCVSDEGPLGELDASTQPPPGPQEASLDRERPEGTVLCFRWNVVGPQGVQLKKTQRQILPKPNHSAVSGKSFSCTDCGKCCRSNADLIQHRRVHSGEKPFPCTECGKCFSKPSSLAIHHRIHTGHKPYSCSECGKCFTSKSELTKHGRSHTGLKPYLCPECGKIFTCSSNLFRHKKIHTGEKQFVCSECGKSFLTRSQMIIHQRVHTGEKPYPCSECGKCFVSSSDLVKHQRSHTGLKPHICPECGKSYVSSSVLTRHQKIHMVENRFFCAECGMGFVRTGKFLAHVKSHRRPRTLSKTPK